MTRPTRNRLVVGAAAIACLLLGNLLRGPFVLLLVAATLTSYVAAYDFFAGRRHLKKKRWMDAIDRLQRFEEKVAKSALRRRLSFLATGVYSSDPIAIARNNVGVVHLENGKLELAERSFSSALERDSLYAVPHLNLAVVAAKRGDEGAREQRLSEAARLGLNQKKVHARVRAVKPGLSA
jgi:hypothetical protein